MPVTINWRNCNNCVTFPTLPFQLPENVRIKNIAQAAVAEPLIHFGPDFLFDPFAPPFVGHSQFSSPRLAQFVFQTPSRPVVVARWHNGTHAFETRLFLRSAADDPGSFVAPPVCLAAGLFPHESPFQCGRVLCHQQLLTQSPAPGAIPFPGASAWPDAPNHGA